MLFMFVFSLSDHGVEKIQIHRDLHKDSGSLAGSPEQLVIRVKQSREKSLRRLEMFKGLISSQYRHGWKVPVSL